ncbi:uncharacterized protein LOC107988376 isoform X2 [Cynoglossus semilaevis]|uniref:uncharacterized protein LOC107988376 isoform X2 n=1 Tax=Cynoglossus semilaevis TaxID=244447 RepID=UPI000D62523E|nr:uncharacterized protein LOC107988376 isoform X2 [Cynoglossus semilaevis]
MLTTRFGVTNPPPPFCKMVSSLVGLCARVFVSDPCWLGWVPGELFKALLKAAFSSCRPLAVGELRTRTSEDQYITGPGRQRTRTSQDQDCRQTVWSVSKKNPSPPFCKMVSYLVGLCARVFVSDPCHPNDGCPGMATGGFEPGTFWTHVHFHRLYTMTFEKDWLTDVCPLDLGFLYSSSTPGCKRSVEGRAPP